MPNPYNTVIVLDNHVAHSSGNTCALAKELGFTMLFLPPSASRLNPIERLWGLLKPRWRHRLIQVDEDISQQQMLIEVRSILSSIPNDTIQGLAKGCRRELLELLEGQVV